MPVRKDQGRQQGKVAADGGYESRGDWRRRAIANSLERDESASRVRCFSS